MKRFRDLRVLVVGDLFLDEYIESEMFEVSREGPIPVVRLRSRTRTPGAAGNLASSIRNLKAAVSVVGIVGRDPNGKALLSGLRQRGVRTSGVIVDPLKPTLTYSKLRARVENTPSREILRMDVLPEGPLDAKARRQVLQAVRREAREVDAIIVLDQIHHLITRDFLEKIPDVARSAGALLHGSSREHIGDFRSFDLITPNDREAALAMGRSADDPALLGRRLRKSGRHRKILLTLGARGMALVPERGAVTMLPSLARDVVDVTGAGDALSSVAVLGNVLGWDLPSVAWAASHAAALAIAEVGTHHVSHDELRKRILDPA
jgi:D-beta-D-heptose 7-phosphate kinase/D-beta-D-heptose 1-phosphate adenosyltransferase